MRTLASRSIGRYLSVLFVGFLIVTFASGCSRPAKASNVSAAPPANDSSGMADMGSAPVKVSDSTNANNSPYTPNIKFTLRTSIAEGKMAFVGVGGTIDGVVNPTLNVKSADVVQVTLINDDGAVHDLFVPDFSAHSEQVIGKGASSTIVFQANKNGEYPYFCSIPGHRQAGMEGKIVVGEPAQAPTPAAASIVRDPADLPGPIASRAPQLVRVNFETKEVEGQLADGTTFNYWTFDGKVPGPFIRVREGDTVELHVKNAANSRMTHSIDLHAVIGPGGGAPLMQVPPGEERTFAFKALHPGLFVYHCATPMHAEHIANGMYGLILVEPEKGLPPVDREFYVMQGEIYTQQPYGQHGHQEFSVEKLLDERPEYFVLNGAVGALTTQHPLQAKVGETVRIYFGDGGPDFTSSFHVIGEVFDKVYDQASLTSAPLTNVQTTLVPPGGATVVEFKLLEPGKYMLVDHALSRMERGLMGFLLVEGPSDPAIYREGPAQ